MSSDQLYKIYCIKVKLYHTFLIVFKINEFFGMSYSEMNKDCV